MRLHEQLGGPEPDDEVETMLTIWRHAHEEGADPTGRYAPWTDPLACPGCHVTTSDGELCGECLSERAEYYHPDEGGEN